MLTSLFRKRETEDKEIFCGYCGERLPTLGEGQNGICPTCRRRFGERRRTTRPPPPPREFVEEPFDRSPRGTTVLRFRDPVLAALLSAVLPGAGQIYNLNFFKGLLVCLTCWLIIPYFLGILDAYVTAERGNRWQTVEIRRYPTQ